MNIMSTLRQMEIELRAARNLPMHVALCSWDADRVVINRKERRESMPLTLE
jgi:hypothetical protein